jgi:hypothetical protein
MVDLIGVVQYRSPQIWLVWRSESVTGVLTMRISILQCMLGYMKVASYNQKGFLQRILDLYDFGEQHYCELNLHIYNSRNLALISVFCLATPPLSLQTTRHELLLE